MNLPELCIRRPVMTTLLMVSLIMAGIFGGLSAKISILFLQALPAAIALFVVVLANTRQPVKTNT